MSGKIENTNLERCRHPNVHSSTIYSRQDMGATQVPINRRTYKENIHAHIHMYDGILFSRKKKNEILPSAALWIELENIIISAVG